MWELVNRCMKRCYQRPFSEYKTSLSFDFSILISAVTKHIRPTMPSNTPASFTSLFRALVEADPKNRLSAAQTLTKLTDIQHQFESSRKQWNDLIIND